MKTSFTMLLIEVLLALGATLTVGMPVQKRQYDDFGSDFGSSSGSGDSSIFGDSDISSVFSDAGGISGGEVDLSSFVTADVSSDQAAQSLVTANTESDSVATDSVPEDSGFIIADSSAKLPEFTASEQNTVLAGNLETSSPEIPNPGTIGETGSTDPNAALPIDDPSKAADISSAAAVVSTSEGTEAPATADTPPAVANAINTEGSEAPKPAEILSEVTNALNTASSEAPTTADVSSVVANAVNAEGEEAETSPKLPTLWILRAVRRRQLPTFHQQLQTLLLLKVVMS